MTDDRKITAWGYARSSASFQTTRCVYSARRLDKFHLTESLHHKEVNIPRFWNVLCQRPFRRRSCWHFKRRDCQNYSHFPTVKSGFAWGMWESIIVTKNRKEGRGANATRHLAFIHLKFNQPNSLTNLARSNACRRRLIVNQCPTRCVD